MPYVFGLLAAANIALFGYFWFRTPPTSTPSFEQAQVQLQKPLTYQNNSDKLPPLIGEK